MSTDRSIAQQQTLTQLQYNYVCLHWRTRIHTCVNMTACLHCTGCWNMGRYRFLALQCHLR